MTAIAAALGRSPRLLRFIANGQKPGINLTAALDDRVRLDAGQDLRRWWKSCSARRKVSTSSGRNIPRTRTTPSRR